jgi:hypothetical protein
MAAAAAPEGDILIPVKYMAVMALQGLSLFVQAKGFGNTRAA